MPVDTSVTSQATAERSPKGWRRQFSLRETQKDFFLLAGCIFLVFAVPIYYGRGTIFWEDEVLGWMLLRDPSMHHMLRSWLHGADGGGISFYLTGRLWFDLFGASVRSFRLYSQVCFATAFAITWIMLRRFYTAAVVTAASLSIWLVSPALVQEMTEGRFYGLLMASVALAIWINMYVAERRRPSTLVYASIFAVNALMVTSHILGIVYSFLVAVHLVWLDHSKRRWRPKLYAMAVFSWFLLIPCLPAIRASARVGKPHFWTTQPSLKDFAFDYTGFSSILCFAIGALLASVAIALVRRKAVKTSLGEALRTRRPIYLIAFLLFMIPVVFLIEGVFGTPLCERRYILPVVLATIYLTAELLTFGLLLLPGRLVSSRLAQTAAWALFLIGLCVYDFGYRPQHNTLHKDYTPTLTENLPHGVPVICEDIFSFTELISRQHGSGVQYTYLLDWSNSIAPQSPRGEVTQYNLMKNWKDVGYFSDSIQDKDAFLKKHPVFYTLSFVDYSVGLTGRKVRTDRSLDIGGNLHKRLARDPNYKVSLFKIVPVKDSDVSVWRTCRIHSAGCD